MAVASRQKACVPCAESKRRCDKLQPECQRCLDRDVDCSYPQVKRRRRSRVEDGEPRRGNAHPSDRPTFERDGIRSLAPRVDTGRHCPPSRAPGSGDSMLQYFATPPPTSTQPQTVTPTTTTDSGTISDDFQPWFLQSETWVLEHGGIEPECSSANELEPFISAVNIMLQFWVKNGHNPMIHRKLYEKGMPSHLQDAYTSLAAYHARTPAMTETILEITDQRSWALLDKGVEPGGNTLEHVRESLALVQSLLMYVFVRIYDGSVRMRASAERQLPTLRRWVTLLWEVARQYKTHDHHHLDSSASASASITSTNGNGVNAQRRSRYPVESDFDAASQTWRLWLLTESVRRTLLIADTVLNIYTIMTQGRAECGGCAMLTARRGLWDAESCTDWAALCESMDPLLVPSLRPAGVLARHGPDEIDDFATLYWTFIVGAERIRDWSERATG